MIRINVAEGVLLGAKSYFTEYLLSPLSDADRRIPASSLEIPNSSHLTAPVNSPETPNPKGLLRFPESEQISRYLPYPELPVVESAKSGGLTQRQIDMLMGKAPLRLVVSRVEFGGFKPKTCWLETLECGHEQIHYLDWCWNEKSRLVQNPPSAKRRRCPECLAMVQKKPVQSVKLPDAKGRRIA